MGEVLSQNEIDDLLKALSTGVIDAQEMEISKTEKKIKLHDFKRPSKFSKEHLRSLQVINETYARLISNFLSGYLRTLVQVDVLTVEPLTFYEFNNSLSNPVVLAVVDFSPLKGSVIMEFPPNVCFALLDRVLGGKGETLEKMREYTEVELVIVEKIVLQLIALLNEAWQNVVDLEPRLEKLETNAQFAQIISPNEIVALVTMNIKLCNVEGMLNLCIPYMIIEPVEAKFSSKFWFTSRKSVEEETGLEKIIGNNLEKTDVLVTAILGKTSLTVNDFLELQIGDVLPLDSSIIDDIDVKVGNILKFKAKPGVKKNKVAIRITEILNKEED